MEQKPGASGSKAISRRHFLAAGLGMGLAGLWGAWSWRRHSAPAGLQRFQRQGRAFGTDIALNIYHADSAIARNALAAAMTEVARLENLFSLYLPHSQISRLNREGALSNPDPALVDILTIAREHSRKTGGAFDATIQPLWALFAQCCWSEKRLPTAAEIQTARELVDYRQIEASPERIAFKKAGMAITLNGIAQGYATDRVLAVLAQHGIEHALASIGEVGALGRNEGSHAWRAGIQAPRKPDDFLASLELNGRCLATSGDYATPFTPDLVNHHILSPQLGQSPAELSSISVLAPRCADADALSTGTFVLGLERGRALIESLKGTDALFVMKDGVTLHRTPGFGPTV